MPRVGRKRINAEFTTARFPRGTLARLRNVLKTKEKRADFLRCAVLAEVRRRETYQRR